MTHKKNRIHILMLLLFCISFHSISQEVSIEQKKVKYYDKDFFVIEGTAFADTVKESPYDRFPASYKNKKVRNPVWGLSKSSAGISIRFFTNSSHISVRWTLLHNANMPHMAETGIKGIDLYFKNNGKWQYVNTARPTGIENEASLVKGMKMEMREYSMYLPLYDGVTSLEVGVDSLSTIKKPKKSDQEPIVFYGTSITQGGCASRPGMVHTSIISRKLDVECINFGFSGNGKMEQPVAELISEIDARFYVIECLPNMNADEVSKRTRILVDIIRRVQPETPIIFVENLMYEGSFIKENGGLETHRKNAALKDEFEEMQQKGYQDIYYIDNNGALGSDHEGTVDGVHFTDLGFLRYADYLIMNFKQSGLIEQ